MSGPRLQVRADGVTAARAAARFVAECARRAVSERGKCVIALSGGRTPRAMLGALVAEDLPWQDLHIFQVDERAAPCGHGERNLTQLQQTLLGKTPLCAATLHAMPVEAEDLEAAASRYAQDLAATTGSPVVLDLVHLGLGDDGHTASLVPGDAALAISDRDVAVSEEYRGYRRMTLTLPLLNRARQRLWLVTGGRKAAMLARLRAGDQSIPAGCVRVEDSVVFADQAAAGQSTT
ncbi:MAG: 6-phosphogluconolactonase [Gammaproteobacteria bacterium]|nr:MAG: 6-phosphogluconolactonase [Gammaproteobacteria bacterium]